MGVKIEVKRFDPEFRFKIFFLYCEITHLKIKFLVKNTLVASYSRALIASKMCRKVIVVHRFDNNF